MSRSIESTLLSLMPSHGSALPPSLVELASSLLAQSRHRASALKAEEEVARSYACCHIASDRLKIQLDLPPIESRPPIPPRIYKRLYTHLDNVLPRTASSRTPRSGSRRDTNTSAATSAARPVPSSVTPSKNKSLAQFRSEGGKNTPTKSTGATPTGQRQQGIHPWIHPTIRFMCRESNNFKLAPSVLAGVESVVAPGGRRTRDEWVERNLAALCGALYFFVVQQVWKIETGENIEKERYLPARKEILSMLKRAREEVEGKALDREGAWEGWHIVKSRDFDDAITEVTDRGWLGGDWFRSLTDVAATLGRDDVQMGDGSEEHEEQDMEKMTVRGADTMFQGRYDFLTDEKRKKYRIWKEGILGRIVQLERQGPERMAVDS